MAHRITERLLRAKVDGINRMLGYSVDNDGPHGWSRELRSIRWDGAYGGHAVHQLITGTGGIHDLTGGHGTARECAAFLDGMIAALHITGHDRT